MNNNSTKLNKIDTISKVSVRVWLVWLSSALFYAFQFVLRISSSIMTNDLMHAFSVQACALGILGAMYYVAYMIMQVPVGGLIDRYGPRHLVTGGLLFCIMGIFIFVKAQSVGVAAVGQFMMGMGSAFAYVGTLKIITIWFPPDYINRIIGLTMVLGTLGGVMGGAPLGFLVEHLDWRDAMLLLGGVGLVLALFAWIMIRDHPRELGYRLEHAVQPTSSSFWQDLGQLIRNPQVVIIGIYAGLMYVPLVSFADLWGVPFMVELYKIDSKLAASMVSMILIGIVIGAPVTTYLSDRFCTRKKFMIYSALSSIIIYSIVIYVPHIPLAVMYILLLLGGLSFTGQVLSFAAVTEILPLAISGMALGLANMIIMLSGVIFKPLTGWLLDHNQKKITDSCLFEIPHYSLENYHLALMPIPLSLICALLLTKFIKETHPNN